MPWFLLWYVDRVNATRTHDTDIDFDNTLIWFHFIFLLLLCISHEIDIIYEIKESLAEVQHTHSICHIKQSKCWCCYFSDLTEKNYQQSTLIWNKRAWMVNTGAQRTVALTRRERERTDLFCLCVFLFSCRFHFKHVFVPSVYIKIESSYNRKLRFKWMNAKTDKKRRNSSKTMRKDIKNLTD